MKVSYFPQMKVVHTSKEFHGQIYIPFANWILMAGTLIVTGVYNNVWIKAHPIPSHLHWLIPVPFILDH